MAKGPPLSTKRNESKYKNTSKVPTVTEKKKIRFIFLLATPLVLTGIFTIIVHNVLVHPDNKNLISSLQISLSDNLQNIWNEYSSPSIRHILSTTTNTSTWKQRIQEGVDESLTLLSWMIQMKQTIIEYIISKTKLTTSGDHQYHSRNANTSIQTTGIAKDTSSVTTTSSAVSSSIDSETSTKDELKRKATKDMSKTIALASSNSNSVTSSPSSSSATSMKESFQDKRIALACVPSEYTLSEQQQIADNDYRNYNSKDCENKISLMSLLEPIKGMVLEVLARTTAHRLTPLMRFSSSSPKDEEDDDTPPQPLNEKVQYELLERVHHELGLADTHYIDFAYRPAHQWYHPSEVESYNQRQTESNNHQSKQSPNPHPRELTSRHFQNEQIVSIQSSSPNNDYYVSNAYQHWFTLAANNLNTFKYSPQPMAASTNRRRIINDMTNMIGNNLLMTNMDSIVINNNDNSNNNNNNNNNNNAITSLIQFQQQEIQAYIDPTIINPQTQTSSSSSTLSAWQLSTQSNPQTSDKINDMNDNKQGSQKNNYAKMGERAIGGGAQGEVWLARRKCPRTHHSHYHQYQDSTCDESQKLIMKRLKVEEGLHLLEAGLREVYFGKLLSQHVNSPSLFTQYVDHFFRQPTQTHSFMGNNNKQKPMGQIQELWIVFQDAGRSLRSYLYTPVSSSGFVIYQHSAFWRKLRRGVFETRKHSSSSSSVVAFTRTSTSEEHSRFDSSTEKHEQQKQQEGEKTKKPSAIAEGKVLMREVLRQLLTSAAILHEQGIIHRDIKPSNIMCHMNETVIGSDNEDEERSDNGADNDDKSHDFEEVGVNCVLGDFSSAWDKVTSQNMYMNGPSAAEQTDEYAPPEVLFGTNDWIPFDKRVPTSYDSWSIGVVALEMLLGTPHVFSVDQRTTAILSNRLMREGASSEDIRRALYLAGLSQFCIYIPAGTEQKKWPLRDGDPLHNTAIVKPTCTIQDFHNALRARDPLGRGFDASADPLLQLIWGLLAWDPIQRITPAEALKHVYFHPPDDDGDMNSSQNNVHFHHNHHHHHHHHHKKHDMEDMTKYHALTPQVLDPMISAKADAYAPSEFKCPQCGKVFHDWNSCHTHARTRKHAAFCDFDRSNLPPCLNAHSMLPAHPTSGYCDIQGRRPTIEDFHSIHLHHSHQFYGVFDGHWGNLASKYSAWYMYAHLQKRWGSGNDHYEGKDLDTIIRTDPNWKQKIEKDLNEAFHELHEGFLKVVERSPGKVMNKSGTTATILITTEEAIIVANIGDSRAILSRGASYHPIGPSKYSPTSATAIQLTVDHVASNHDEKLRIQGMGGYVSKSGSIERVNGTLAITRSIGDVPLMDVLSQSPHVWAMTKKEAQILCKKSDDNSDNVSNDMPCFAVLASDGLWDVVSNQEAVEMVIDVLKQYHSGDGGISWEDGGAFQLAAQKLTQEAYIRGSTDNIGVCVVAIT